MTRRFLDPRNDVVFKRIFGEHPEILRSFLNALLPLPGGPIASLEYLPAETAPIVPMINANTLNVRCQNQAGRQMIVEVQMRWSNYFLSQAVFEGDTMHITPLGRFKTHHYPVPLIALTLLDDTYMSPGGPGYHHYSVIKAVGKAELVEGLEFVFIELPKFAKVQSSGGLTEQTAWLRFLNDTDNLSLERGKQTAAEQRIPEIGLAQDLAEEGAFNLRERASIERYWDAVRVERTMVSGVRQKGYAEGHAEDFQLALERMSASGYPAAEARRILGLYSGFQAD